MEEKQLNVTMEFIDDWADRLVERWKEVRYFEPDKAKAALIAHFKSAIIDCMEARFTSNQAAINKLIEQKYKDPRGEHLINIEISKLRANEKRFKKIRADILDHDEYVKFKRFVFDRAPELLKEWAELTPSKPPIGSNTQSK